MGYYDYDEHFWSPLEVCAQAPQKEPRKRKLNVTELIQSILSATSRPSNSLLKTAKSAINQIP